MTWDYIIVGAGSAGCVLASRLSGNPSCRVLLLEAGWGFLDRTPLVSAPAGAWHAYGHPLFDWRCPTEPDPSCANRAQPVYSGKLLGGSSSINGMMFIRGHARDFDEWEHLGNSSWSYRDALPFFKRMEHTEIGCDAYHGRLGPLGVEYASPMLDISHCFIEAATEAGIPYNSDINGERLEGISRTPCSAYGGIRQSTARCYLRPAMKRRNLTVITCALVHRVLFEGKEAIGVEYERFGGKRVARASREIILSAGGVRSPHILLLSGVGAAEQPSDITQMSKPIRY